MAMIWKLELTEEMVSHLSGAEISQLIDELNDAVHSICNGFDVQ